MKSTLRNPTDSVNYPERCGFKPLPPESYKDVNRAATRFLMARERAFQENSARITEINNKIKAERAERESNYQGFLDGSDDV